jgi:hypothetical protein
MYSFSPGGHYRKAIIILILTHSLLKMAATAQVNDLPTLNVTHNILTIHQSLCVFFKSSTQKKSQNLHRS